jgi:C4-dicarboxylate-specific signal transduction histidine kinase
MAERYAGKETSFAADLADHGITVPAALFNSVAENLLQNAADKRKLQPAMPVAVRLHSENGKAVLEVTDGGSEIPAAIAATLLRGPVVSENGLGIGLYQAARHAELGGYRLLLAENRPGCVCFRLQPA